MMNCLNGENFMALDLKYFNRYLRALIHIIKRINAGEEIKKKTFVSTIQAYFDLPTTDMALDYANDFLENYNVFHIENDVLKLNVPVSINLPLSKAEELWLQMAMEHPIANYFFTDKDINCIESKMEKNSNYNYCEYFEFVTLGQKTKTPNNEQVKNFNTILEAIEKKRCISYLYKTREGAVHDHMAIPVKIEFSLYDQVMRVSLFNLKENRLFKANVDRFKTVKIGRELKDQERFSVKDELEKKKATENIVLKIKNEKNAIERAALLFSQYNRKNVLENDYLLMEITYYEFDKNIMLNHILTLGPLAEVLSPAEIRDEVIRRICF